MALAPGNLRRDADRCSLAEAQRASVGVAGYTLALIVGVVLGAFFGWTMWATHWAVGNKIIKAAPAREEWYFGALYFTKLLWIALAQLRGWELFKGKAKCIQCHLHSEKNPLFTDFKFHNTGIAAVDALFHKLTGSVPNPAETQITFLAHSEDFSELRRFAVTREQVDIGAFKTPTLRDVELTSPYMHNGSLKTLIEVVQFYNRGGSSNSYLDRLMEPLHLSDNEVNDLVQFIRALTSDDVLSVCQTTSPQTRIAVPVK